MYEEYVCLAFFLRFSPPAFLGALADFFDGVLAIHGENTASMAWNRHAIEQTQLRKT